MREIYKDEIVGEATWLLHATTSRRPQRNLFAQDAAAKEVCELSLTAKPEWFFNEGEPGRGWMTRWVPDDGPRVSKLPGEAFSRVGEPDKATIDLVAFAGDAPRSFYFFLYSDSRRTYSWFVAAKTEAQKRMMLKFKTDIDGVYFRSFEAINAWVKLVLSNTKWPMKKRRISLAYLEDDIRPSVSDQAPLLYDAGNTELFDGGDVEQEIITINGIAYLRATRQSLIYGPDMAVFRLGDDGELIPLCWQQYPREEETMNQFRSTR